jgi:LCP family protein required for cell wall assembly
VTEPRDWRAGDPPPDGAPPPPATGAGPRSGRPVRPAPPAGPRRPPGRRPAAPGPAGEQPPPTARATPPRTAALPSPPVPPPSGRHVLPASVPPGRRRRRAARILSWIAVVTSVTVLATAGTGYALLTKYDGNIERIGGRLGLPGADRPDAAPRDARNMLIVGSDTRGDLAPGDPNQGIGKEFVSGQRADTIVLAHLYGDSDQAQLVSFPRDSYVQIPSFQDPATGDRVPAHQAKINQALQLGGPSLLVATVEQLTDVRIDHYVQIDFEGFQQMVDELGGVEVCLSEPAKERDSGIDLQAGRQTIEGAQALAFVRQRKGLPRGDIDRIARQQQFMGAVIRKTLSAGTLLNPLKLNGFLDAATDSLQVDQGTTLGDLRDLALRMRGADAGGVVFATIPTSDIGATRNGESVVLLDEPAVDALFDGIRRDVPPGEAEPVEEVPGQELVVAPSAVSVQVYNGAGISGLGRQAAADLEEVGFRLAGAPSDRGRDATTTTVLHGPGRDDAARTLAAALPGAVVELDPSLGRTLEVVVGADYDGAVPVTVGALPPVPAADPTEEPVLTAADDVCAP